MDATMTVTAGETMEPIDTGLFFEGVSCPHCAATIIHGFDNRDATEPDSFAEPGCEHVFLIAHDLGIAYLSKDARSALVAAGIDISAQDDMIELGSDSEEDDLWTLVGRGIRWPSAQVLAVYAPAPAFDGTYVGVVAQQGAEWA